MAIISRETLLSLAQTCQEKPETGAVALRRGQPPENLQVGATCGIYSLDGALRLHGGWYAPPRHLGSIDPITRLSRPSARHTAKLHGSVIGEISSCEAVQSLAACQGYALSEIKSVDSPSALWRLVVESARHNRGIVMPYMCCKDGEPAGSTGDGFAHWCLVFGGVKNAKGEERLFAITYGNYRIWSTRLLQESNAAIRDWEQQYWIKCPVWYYPPNAAPPAFPRANIWQRARDNDWLKLSDDPNDPAGSLETIANWAHGAYTAIPQWGFGLGNNDTKSGPEVVIVRPGGPQPNLPIPSGWLRQRRGATVRELKKIEYSKTMAGRCVVV